MSKLSVALGVRMKNKRKMADGGVVKPKTLGETIGYPKRMADGGMVESNQQDNSPVSIAQLIRKRKQVAQDDSQADLDANNQEHLEPTLDELQEMAAEEAAQGDVEEQLDDHMSRIAAIRKRRMGRI